MFVITKKIEWAMGHRVHNQLLNAERSCNSTCKCKFLHGHSYAATITVASETLQNNMVMDFTDLKFIKQWIDTNLDHKFMFDAADEMLPLVTGQDLDDLEETALGIKTFPYVDGEGAEIELAKSIIVVDYVPTSEEIAAHIFAFVEDALGVVEKARVISVTVQESPSSSATYHGVAYV